MTKQCSIPGCDKPFLARGLCKAHYARLRNHGDPLGGQGPRGAALEFFKNKVLTHQGDGCLMWPFARSRGEYGHFFFEGRTQYVHRLVCEHIHGPAPTEEHEAAHSCGNSTCVNPWHLRWATRTENCADMIGHGTLLQGERHPNSKLTESDVRAIREMSGTHREIGAKFGVSETTIRKVKTRRKWQHLDKDVKESAASTGGNCAYGGTPASSN